MPAVGSDLGPEPSLGGRKEGTRGSQKVQVKSGSVLAPRAEGTGTGGAGSLQATERQAVMLSPGRDARLSGSAVNDVSVRAGKRNGTPDKTLPPRARQTRPDPQN